MVDCGGDTVDDKECDRNLSAVVADPVAFGCVPEIACNSDSHWRSDTNYTDDLFDHGYFEDVDDSNAFDIEHGSDDRCLFALYCVHCGSDDGRGDMNNLDLLSAHPVTCDLQCHLL